MLRIKLNADVQSMFPLLHLSWENPGPIDVDPAKLTSVQLQWIDNAKKKGVLIVKDLDGPIEAAPSQVKKQEVTSLKSVTVSADRLQKEGEAKKALKAPVAALTSLINNSNDVFSLRIMKELESSGKKRAKVLDLLSKKIEVLQSKVSSIVGPALTEKDLFIQNIALRNLPEIEEEIEGEKTVTLKQE